MHVGLVDEAAVAQRDVLEDELDRARPVHVGLRVLQVEQVGGRLLRPERDSERLDVRGVHALELQALVRRLARMQRIDRRLNYRLRTENRKHVMSSVQCVR